MFPVFFSCAMFDILHRDHAGGNQEMSGLVPGLTACGNDDRIDALNKRVKHNDKFNVSVAIRKHLI